MAIGDMFLKVETARQGMVKGESMDSKHESEIDVVSWSWGMRSQTAMSAGGPSATGRSTLNELEVVKLVDSASTALMSAMRNNELIKKAALTVRKAGAEPALEYLRITVQNARITSLEIQTNGPDVTERMTLAFKRISVEYTPQGKDGQARGGMMFETEIAHT
ncbi:MAG: Hcp family type VI secretion system effector [Burkholderiales bacterium]